MGYKVSCLYRSWRVTRDLYVKCLYHQAYRNGVSELLRVILLLEAGRPTYYPRSRMYLLVPGAA